MLSCKQCFSDSNQIRLNSELPVSAKLSRYCTKCSTMKRCGSHLWRALRTVLSSCPLNMLNTYVRFLLDSTESFSYWWYFQIMQYICSICSQFLVLNIMILWFIYTEKPKNHWCSYNVSFSVVTSLLWPFFVSLTEVRHLLELLPIQK